MSDPIRLDSFRAEAHQLLLPIGLTVDWFRLETGVANGTTSPFSLTLEQPGRFEARVDEKAIAAFLEKQEPGGMKGFVVSCQDGLMTVNAMARVLLEIPVEAQFKVVIKDRRELVVELIDAKAAGGNARRLVEGQLDRINPVLSADQIPFPVEFEKVEVKDGGLLLWGNANLPSGQSS